MTWARCPKSCSPRAKATIFHKSPGTAGRRRSASAASPAAAASSSVMSGWSPRSTATTAAHPSTFGALEANGVAAPVASHSTETPAARAIAATVSALTSFTVPREIMPTCGGAKPAAALRDLADQRLPPASRQLSRIHATLLARVPSTPSAPSPVTSQCSDTPAPEAIFRSVSLPARELPRRRRVAMCVGDESPARRVSSAADHPRSASNSLIRPATSSAMPPASRGTEPTAKDAPRAGDAGRRRFSSRAR